ncbi:ABC-2 type transport system permease protein [Marisediminicola sp. UYEF4]|uniref:ABC transporter permease subunit n=1 Tax=Marisediminicola sp. UYEF4 TaxID=1756384 RepID=UPI003394C570
MSTTTAPQPLSAEGVDRLPRLSFGGILRSEWIKLVSLRSTIWCYALIVVGGIGFGVLVALTFPSSTTGEVPDAVQQSTAVQVATLALGFTALASVVLGALVITGEYGTGMIRSTFAAVPRRLPALFGKVVVFGVTTFAVGLVTILGTALVTAPMLPGIGVTPDFAEPAYLIALVGGAGYLALIGVFALALGAIVRHSAGAIASALGVILVLPTVALILSAITQAEWIQSAARFLPDVAGGRMFVYTAGEAAATDVLAPWQGLLVLLAWDAALLLLAAVLMKRRDA